MSSALIASLQILFAVEILIFGVSFAAKLVFPNSNLHRRIWRLILNYAFVKPLKFTFRGSKWLLMRLFTTQPEYRLQQTFLENYPLTPLAFYQSFEEAFARRQIIGVEITRINRLEWHLLSGSRIYLLLRFRGAVCILSGVTLGTGFLASWRYSTNASRTLLILFQVPFVGAAAQKMLTPPTFYRTDLYYAFEQIVRSSILETTNLLTAQEGIRPLTENETRPLLREFYGN